MVASPVKEFALAEGIPPAEACSERHPQELRDRWGRTLFEFVMRGLFEHRLLHADPNLANILTYHVVGDDLDAAAVVASLRRNGHPAVELVRRLDDVPKALGRLVEDGDVVLTLGAGNVRSVGLDLVDARRPRRRKGGK